MRVFYNRFGADLAVIPRMGKYNVKTPTVTLIGLLTALLLMLPSSVLAQGRGGRAPRAGSHGVGGGHIPAHGPAPMRGQQRPAPEHPNYTDQRGHPNAPHVHGNDRWIGHSFPSKDSRFHLDHPWEHGRFTGGIGRGHIFRLAGGNARLGTYVHVTYLGGP
jgi:hypothetical protein